jgi:hypothetical protein
VTGHGFDRGAKGAELLADRSDHGLDDVAADVLFLVENK